MTTYVALLRAVNVGGHASLPMAGLRDSLAGLGYANVRTYLQSGNAVFDAASGSRQEHAAAIALRIERDFGPRVGVLVLDADDVARVVAANPFTAVDRLTSEDRRRPIPLSTSGGSTRPSSSARLVRRTSARRRRRPTAQCTRPPSPS